jgi:hypothetical protein
MADIREECRTLDPADDSEEAELILDDTQVLFQHFHTVSSFLVRLYSIHENGPAIYSPARLYSIPSEYLASNSSSQQRLEGH